MPYQNPHLDLLLVEALNSAVLPDATPLKQASLSGPDVKRACRLLEELAGQPFLLGELSTKVYTARVTRWHQNRDHLCQQLERQGTALLRDGM